MEIDEDTYKDSLTFNSIEERADFLQLTVDEVKTLDIKYKDIKDNTHIVQIADLVKEFFEGKTYHMISLKYDIPEEALKNALKPYLNRRRFPQ